MIPRIDVRRQAAAGVYEGELSFSFEGDGSLIDIPYVSFSSPVRAELRYEIFEEDEAEVHGTISFSLKGLCSRCLAETETAVSYEAEGAFVPRESDGEEYSYKNGQIDLAEFLRDAVMFALPGRLLCEKCGEEINTVKEV